MNKYKNTVSDFVRYLVQDSPNNILFIDDSGYVCKHIEDGDDEYMLVPVPVPDTPGEVVNKKLIVYSECITDNDAVILNPFVESIGNQVSDNNLFYDIKTAMLGSLITNLMEFIILKALEKESDKKKNKDDLKIIKFISEFVSDIDSKTINEFKLITASATDVKKIFNIKYKRTNKSSSIICSIFNDTYKAGFGNSIRKKTWTLFENILEKLLGTKNPQKDLSYTSRLINIPMLDSYLQVYYIVLNNISDYIPFIGHHADLKYFKDNIDDTDKKAEERLIHKYYLNASWCINTVQVSITPIEEETKEEMISLVQDNNQMISLEVGINNPNQMINLEMNAPQQQKSDDFVPWNPSGLPNNNPNFANVSLGYHNQCIPMYANNFNNNNQFTQYYPQFGSNNMIPL